MFKFPADCIATIAMPLEVATATDHLGGGQCSVSFVCETGGKLPEGRLMAPDATDLLAALIKLDPMVAGFDKHVDLDSLSGHADHWESADAGVLHGLYLYDC